MVQSCAKHHKYVITNFNSLDIERFDRRFKWYHLKFDDNSNNYAGPPSALFSPSSKNIGTLSLTVHYLCDLPDTMPQHLSPSTSHSTLLGSQGIYLGVVSALKSDPHLPKKLPGFLHWKSFKNDKECFLLHLKSYFRSQHFIKTFWSCRKKAWLER